MKPIFLFSGGATHQNADCRRQLNEKLLVDPQEWLIPNAGTNYFLLLEKEITNELGPLLISYKGKYMYK